MIFHLFRIASINVFGCMAKSSNFCAHYSDATVMLYAPMLLWCAHEENAPDFLHRLNRLLTNGRTNEIDQNKYA